MTTVSNSTSCADTSTAYEKEKYPNVLLYLLYCNRLKFAIIFSIYFNVDVIRTDRKEPGTMIRSKSHAQESVCVSSVSPSLFILESRNASTPNISRSVSLQHPNDGNRTQSSPYYRRRIRNRTPRLLSMQKVDNIIANDAQFLLKSQMKEEKKKIGSGHSAYDDSITDSLNTTYQGIMHENAAALIKEWISEGGSNVFYSRVGKSLKAMPTIKAYETESEIHSTNPRLNNKVRI